MEKMDMGLIGLGVMGSSLVLNMAEHGFRTACWNYTRDLTEKMLAEHPHENIRCFFELQEFLQSLKRPRRIMLMIMAGEPVDSMLEQLAPLLDTGDIVMDCGNSYFRDTRRRSAVMEQKGIHYFGVGVSGGEKGARFGPSIMPGGNREAYPQIQPVLEAIAARAAGEPCCSYIGPDGAGHYVKMVHNGIEYADMQLIAEAYLLLRYAGGLEHQRISEIFHEWNQGELRSYLIGITADIFMEKDEDGAPLLDRILGSAGQKGTGRWTSIEALRQGVNISMITAACNARIMSNKLEERQEAAQQMLRPAVSGQDAESFIEAVKHGLYAAKIAAYAQGFSLYRSASEQYGWQLDFGRIAAIFRAGCIIQARFLDRITEACTRRPELRNLMLDTFFLQRLNENIPALRQVVCSAVQAGLPVPVFANALEYIDAYSRADTGANLLQAQRDYFGAHTYQRTDRPGIFHHEWQEHYPQK